MATVTMVAAAAVRLGAAGTVVAARVEVAMMVQAVAVRVMVAVAAGVAAVRAVAAARLVAAGAPAAVARSTRRRRHPSPHRTRTSTRRPRSCKLPCGRGKGRSADREGARVVGVCGGGRGGWGWCGWVGGWVVVGGWVGVCGAHCVAVGRALRTFVYISAGVPVGRGGWRAEAAVARAVEAAHQVDAQRVGGAVVRVGRARLVALVDVGAQETVALVHWGLAVARAVACVPEAILPREPRQVHTRRQLVTLVLIGRTLVTVGARDAVAIVARRARTRPRAGGVGAAAHVEAVVRTS